MTMNVCPRDYAEKFIARFKRNPDACIWPPPDTIPGNPTNSPTPPVSAVPVIPDPGPGPRIVYDDLPPYPPYPPYPPPQPRDPRRRRHWGWRRGRHRGWTSGREREWTTGRERGWERRRPRRQPAPPTPTAIPPPTPTGPACPSYGWYTRQIRPGEDTVFRCEPGQPVPLGDIVAIDEPAFAYWPAPEVEQPQRAEAPKQDLLILAGLGLLAYWILGRG